MIISWGNGIKDYSRRSASFRVRTDDSAICVPAMADLDDEDGLLGVVNGIDDSIIALADPVFFFLGKLLPALRTGIFRQAGNALDQPGQVCGGEPAQLLLA